MLTDSVCREGVYAGATLAQVKQTLAILRCYRDFVRSSSPFMRDPESSFPYVITRLHAARRLSFLIHAAINRKAGPEPATRKRSGL